jgi:GntR family transcriptional regulator
MTVPSAPPAVAVNANAGGSIDFASPLPYYVQLMRLLGGKIANGELSPGAQLPGEPELCNLYGISRTVVRQALGEMEQQNLIVRRKGKGTFVAAPKVNESLAQKLTGFYRDMVERGYRVTTEVLHHRVAPANGKVAEYLQVELDSPVIDIRRLRFINDEPIQLVTSYLPYALCPRLAEVDLTQRSLYDVLENECGLIIARGRRFIEAVAANDSEAKLLRIERGAPLVMLDSVSLLEDGRPVEYYHAVHRGDRSRFEVELVRVREHTISGEDTTRPATSEKMVLVGTK